MTAVVYKTHVPKNLVTHFGLKLQFTDENTAAVIEIFNAAMWKQSNPHINTTDEPRKLAWRAGSKACLLFAAICCYIYLINYRTWNQFLLQIEIGPPSSFSLDLIWKRLLRILIILIHVCTSLSNWKERNWPSQMYLAHGHLCTCSCKQYYI